MSRGCESCCCQLNFQYGVCSSKDFLDIQATIECRFTLKLVRDMIITYSQMQRTDKYSQRSSIILVNLAKWFRVRLRTKWLRLRIPLLSNIFVLFDIV